MSVSVEAQAIDSWTKWIGRCAQICTLVLAAGLLVASVWNAAQGLASKWTVLLVVVSVGALERLWKTRGVLDVIAEIWRHRLSRSDDISGLQLRTNVERPE